MNYQKHYTALICKYGLREKPLKVYTEGHHVIPKSLGGSDSPDNIRFLTPRLHLLAHWLLMRIHNNMAMRVAFSTMCSRKGVKLTPKMYEIARKAVSGENSGVSRKVHTPLGWFGSVREAARAHNTVSGNISTKASSNKVFHSEYYYEGASSKTETCLSGKHLAVRIHTPEGIFESVRAAALHYRVYHSTISKWCKSKPNEFYKEDDTECSSQRQIRQVHTPLGWFTSVSAAAKAMGLSGPGVISSRCKAGWDGYYYSE